MFRRLHYKLTGLCALITVGILAVFTLLYLTVSEHTLSENHKLSFQHDFDTICSSLEQQQTVTFQYLLRMEQNNGYLLFLWDNKEPLSFNLLESHKPYLELAEELYASYIVTTGAAAKNSVSFLQYDLADESGYMGISQMAAGQMSAAEYQNSFQEEGLILLVLSPNTAFHRQLLTQRLLFLMLSCIACLILILFAFLFTGKLLKPIQKNQEKQLQFVANASHELRTPLAVILSSLSIKPPGYEGTIAEEAQRMSHLVDDMLFLTSLETGKNKLSFSRVEPDTFLLNFYEQTESFVHQSKHAYSLTLPEEAMPAFSCDPEKIKQLLLNLLQNAISYTPEGGQIALRLFASQKELCFQVIDNGVGIAPEKKKEIFERFYRADSSRHTKEHYGLGLCIAKEIMLAHRGRIELSDTPGGGSTFSCYFPTA